MRRTPLLFLAIFLLAGLLAAFAARPAPAGTVQLDDYEIQVVRAYYDDPALVAEVAAWTEPWEVNRREGYIVLEVNPAQFQQLLDLGFHVEVDLALTEQINSPRVPLPGQGGGIPGFPCYRTVEETFDSAVDMVNAYPTLASWIDVGDSWEKFTPGGNDGYDLNVLRLTNSAIPGPKPVFFATSAIHAREYTTAELATRYAEYLLENYGTDPDVTWILDYHEIHLLLQANPDGRKMAETGLSWRKNTNNNFCSNTNTRGVDLNRNFEFQWGCCGGSSGNECSITYRGPSPASEPEVQAVQAYGQSIFPDQRDDPLDDPAPDDATGIYIDIHSSGRLVLWPWGFTNDLTGNWTQLQTLGRKLAYFNDHYPEQAIGLYPTDGTTDDFFYGDMGVAAYTFELGTAFFESCSYFENTILPDNLDSLLYSAKVVRTPYMTPAGPDALQVVASPDTVAPGDPLDLTATINDARFNNQNGTEPVQNIAAAEYYIDVPPWITDTTPIALPMTAVDGNFNSTVEDVEAAVDTSSLANGRHTIYVRGQDVAGNWGPFSAVFVYIIDPDVAPTAGFTSNSPVPLGNPAEFTNTSTGTNLSFAWDFGDGSPISNEVNPTHTYTAAMTFTVVLTAENNLGTDVFTDTVVVLEEEVAPSASFTVSPVMIFTGREVQFTNTSTGTNLTFNWDFGDGSPPSTEANPTHIYLAPGMYTVILTATNDLGSDSSQATFTVLVNSYLPVIFHEP